MSLTIKQAFEALSDACANGMKNPFFVMRRLKESFADVASKVVDASGDKVTVTQTLTEGTEIGSIKVNNDTTVLYAPASSGGGGFNFSTEEQVIGSWTDGKILYQKTFTGTSQINGNAWTDTGITLPSDIIIQNAFSVTWSPSNDTEQILPCIVNRITDYTPNHLGIYSFRSTGYSAAPISVTIQYTKTTD